MRGLLLLVAVVLASCSQASDPPRELYFPTWTPQPGPVPTGVLEGRLVERNGCLIWSDGAEYLPIWPDDFELDNADTTIAATSGVVLAVGDEGTLVGGERNLRQAESLIGMQIPSSCQSDGYWMVTEVVPG